MSQQPLPSGTVTFLFTDIERSTQLLQRLGDEYASVLADQRRILRAAFERYEGVEIDTQGDSFFVVFKRAVQAVKAVAEAQRSLATHPWPRGESLRVRMALHTGEPEIGPTGYVGLDVHRAARICSAGYGGQVLLSEATRALVEGALPGELSLQDLGEHRLKDLQRPEHIYQLVIPGLPSEFPPLKSLNLRPNNLPLQLTSFIGREREIEEVIRLLKVERLVSLVGAGGSGKTRLAIQAAAEVLSEPLADEFQHGVWFIDLAPLSSPAFVAQAIAAVLSLHEEAGRTITDVLVNALRARRTLLILDNCEHLVEACASLVEGLLLACPRLRILVTSREALGIAGESLLPIPTLSLPDLQLLARKPGEHLPLVQDSEAARLFVERAGRVQPGFRLTESNSLPIAQVCRRLDGIPLAIELAAARARVLSVEQILARLDERFLLLTGGSRTALPRQQTLQALVDWSYDLLSEPERRLFRRLSVFAGGWTLEAAEAVCAGGDIESRQVLDLLTRLVDKSLVVAEPGEGGRRFRLLETIRQYAQERRRADGPEDDLPQRHFDYYSNLVEESEKGLTGPDTSAWLKLLDAEKDNVYAALTWAAQAGAALQGDPRDADLADAAQFMAGRMWEFWLARGALSEGRHWLELTLRSGDRRGSPRAKALVSAGIMSWQQGDYAEAFRWLDESISILRELEPPDQPGLANATHMLGHAALDQNDFTTATQAFQESLELYRALDDQYYVGTLISDLGMVAYHQGDYRAARLYQEESLAVFQKHGNSEIIAQTMHRLGELARLEEDYDRAEEYYESCLSTYREIGIQLDIASNLHKLGYIAQRKGDFELARARFTESLSIQRQAGNKQGMIECLAGLAGLAAATGQPTRALRLYGAAQAWLDSTGMPLAPADLVEWKRDQTLACGQLDEAACLQAQAEGRLMTAEQAIEYARSGANDS